MPAREIYSQRARWRVQRILTSWLVALDSWWKGEFNNRFGVVIGISMTGAIAKMAVGSNGGGGLRQSKPLL